MANCNGADLKWYSAATSGNLLGEGNNFQLTNINSAMTVYAECSLTSCGTSTRAPLNITYQSLCPYCDPIGLNCTFGDAITQVKIKKGDDDIYENNTPDCSNIGYILFTPINTIELEKNESYKIVTANPGTYADGLSIWVDYNHNNTFEEGERIESYYPNVTWTSHETNFTIPTSSTSGSTRVRFKVSDGVFSPDPCSSSDGGGYGEIQDYIINISAPGVICPDELEHAKAVLSPGSFYASQTIISKADVSNPTTYQAGKSILLDTGFQAGTNETFEATIGGCPE